MYVFESSRVKKGGPPLHSHYTQDEWFYILEGEFIFRVDEQNFTAKAGDSVFGPRMLPHAFAKTNEGVARMLTVFQPTGKMEENFRAIADGKVAHLSAEERHQFRQAHGLEVIGPGLNYTKQ